MAKFEALYKKASEFQAEKNYIEAIGCYNEALDYCDDPSRRDEIRLTNIEKCVGLEVGTKMFQDTAGMKQYKTSYASELFPQPAGGEDGQ